METDRAPLHCTFTLSAADFVALRKVLNRRLAALAGLNTKLFVMNLLVWIPLGVGIAAYAALFRKYPAMSYDLAVVAGVFCLGVALLAGATLYRRRLYARAMLAPDSWFLAEQTVDVSPDGLSATSAYGSAHYPWSTVRHLAEDDANLYLFIDNAQAFVLPMAALGSSGALARVRAWSQI